MTNSINYNSNIYMPGKLALLRNYVARISAFLPFQGGSLPKFKYIYENEVRDKVD